MSGLAIAMSILLYLVSLIVLYVIAPTLFNPFDGFSVVDLQFFLTLTITFWVSVYVLKSFGIIGAGAGSKLAEQEKQSYAAAVKKSQNMNKWLEAAESFAYKIGFEPTENDIFAWDFILQRCTEPIEAINRRIKPVELIGLIKAAQFLVIFISAYVWIRTFSPIGIAVAVVGALLPSAVKAAFNMMITAEDKELELDFPDLYLLLYCNLTQGVNTRIAPALADYLRSADALYSPEEHKAIRKFVRALQNNIAIYADESEALVNMRRMYKSATIINFCNIACQSLRGVDTKDKLFNFKIELQTKQTAAMEAEAKRRVETGRRVIIMVYVILAEFVLLSWGSKLGF